MAIPSEIDLAVLLAATEEEIMRVVADRDASTVGVYEMIRYHLGLDGATAPRGKRMRPLLGLLAYSSIAGDHRAALPGAAAVELGHNFSLVHDDIEDGDTERRHRPTLWALHGVPQAINTGDRVFGLSRDRAPPPDRARVLATARSCRLMRLYDETCLRAVRGPVHRHLDVRADDDDDRSSSTST